MLAVFQTGGKQYKVAPGDEIQVEKVPGKVGGAIKFNNVLMMESGKTLKVGAPLLEGVEVAGEILRQAKAKKIIVFKFKRRKKYRKKQGHRQHYTRLKITHIGKAQEPQPASVKEEVEAPAPVAVNE